VIQTPTHRLRERQGTVPPPVSQDGRASPIPLHGTYWHNFVPRFMKRASYKLVQMLGQPHPTVPASVLHQGFPGLRYRVATPSLNLTTERTHPLRVLAPPGRLSGWDQDWAKTEVEVPVVREAPSAERRAAVPGVVAPTAAPDYPARGLLRTRRIRHSISWVFAIPI